VTDVPDVVGLGLAVTAVVVVGLPYVMDTSEAPGMVGYAMVECDEFTIRMSVGVLSAGSGVM
jgi:hypothetical protein